MTDGLRKAGFVPVIFDEDGEVGGSPVRTGTVASAPAVPRGATAAPQPASQRFSAKVPNQANVARGLSLADLEAMEKEQTHVRVQSPHTGTASEAPGRPDAVPRVDARDSGRMPATVAGAIRGDHPTGNRPDVDDPRGDGRRSGGVLSRTTVDTAASVDHRSGTRTLPTVPAGDGTLTSPTLQALAASPFSALLGSAGTGKTYLLKQWLREAELGTLTMVATTGIAAVNLGDATTINALLKYFDTHSLTELYTAGMLTMRLKKLRRAGLRRIILDELSMLDGNQLTVLVRAIDECNGEGYDFDELAEADKDLPPLGLTVCGDWCQLPPVKAPFAFESPEWGRFSIQKLTKVWRQTDDRFVEALQAARRGDGAAAVEALEPCFTDHTDPHFEGPTLLATNEAVDRYNRLRMDHLDGREHSFRAVRDGEQRPEWKKNIPDLLTLKEGCLVMVLANRYDHEEERYLYVNGDLGTFEGVEDGGALVTLQRTNQTERVGLLTREVTEPLEPGERKQLKAEGLGDRIREKAKVTGSITYMPLRVSYATSIHKSQGLSLDAVQVNLREPFMASPGMVYVALSRARTLEGLRLIGTPKTLVARCTVSEKVRGWI